jgi:hypothetical protein
MSQSEDMDAIEAMFKRSVPSTDQAATVRQLALKWFSELSWYDRTYDDDSFQTARQRREAYFVADKQPPRPKDDGIYDSEVNTETGEVNLPTSKQMQEGYKPTGKRLDESGNVAKPKSKSTVAPITNGTTTVSTGPGKRADQIGPGSTGPTVTELQAFLGVPLTGTFDKKTENALYDWEARNGRKRHPWVGPNTWAIMDRQKPPVPVQVVVEPPIKPLEPPAPNPYLDEVRHVSSKKRVDPKPSKIVTKAPKPYKPPSKPSPIIPEKTVSKKPSLRARATGLSMPAKVGLAGAFGLCAIGVTNYLDKKDKPSNNG